MADDARARPPDDNNNNAGGSEELLPLPELPSGRFLSNDDDDDLDLQDLDPPSSSLPASPTGQQQQQQQKERGWLRIHNVGGSLTFLLQVLSAAIKCFLESI